MSTLNQFDIAKTLGSEIVGRSRDSQGQISTPGVVQSYFDLRGKSVAPAEIPDDIGVDKDKVVQAFYDVRDDQRSPDLYVADPDRNRRFLNRCRELGETASNYAINKTLLNARKAGKSKDAKWEPEYEMPELENPLPLFASQSPVLPDERGVYLLLEKSRTLYVHGTRNLSRGIELHRHVDFRRTFASFLWDPNPDELQISFATVPEAKLMRPVELRLIFERKPLFNIVNAAA